MTGHVAGKRRSDPGVWHVGWDRRPADAEDEARRVEGQERQPLRPDPCCSQAFGRYERGTPVESVGAMFAF